MSTKDLKGKLITFEGIDRCGKTTQIKMLSNWLNDQVVDHLVSREPGGTALGAIMRHTLKYPSETYAILNNQLKSHPDYEVVDINQKRTSEAEVLMYLASRAEYAQKVLKPALESGKIVISDRLGDSTRAYQGGGLYNSDVRKTGLIHQMNQFALGGIWPDLTFLLDISYDVSRARKGVDEVDDELEKRKRGFFERTIREYHQIAREEPDRFVVVDASRPPREVFSNYVCPAVDKLLFQ